MIRLNILILLAVFAVRASGFMLEPRRRHLEPIARTAPFMSSLFDPDDKEESNAPASRKFTGYTPTKSSSNPSARERMIQREYDLVSLATSPAAFLVQAASILVVLAFVLYVGATGQLGLNNDYEDDDLIYDPVSPSVVVPTVEFQSSGQSVFL